MTIEEQICIYLKQVTPEVFPTQAAESQSRPYIVYLSSTVDEFKALSGWTNLKTVRFEVHVIHTTYSEMKVLFDLVREKMQSIEQTTANGIYIQSVEIDPSAPEASDQSILSHEKVLIFDVSY
jgi:hypothetical protein